MPRFLEKLSHAAVAALVAALLISCGPRPGKGGKTPAGGTGGKPPVAAGPLVVTTDKASYFRYDVVEVRVKADAAKIGALAPADLAGVVTRDGKPVTTVGKMRALKFRATGAGAFAARWPVPWNPPLGKYRADVKAKGAAASCDFEITGRKVARPARPLCVVTLESDGQWERLGVDSPGPNHNWKALVDWAQFMGADAFFSLTGITKAMYGPTMENPWYGYNLKFEPKLADECHARGIKFGGWIGTFLPYGKTQVPLPYEFSRNLVDKQFFYTLHISLNDAQRRKQVVDLARRLQNDPRYDFVGFDYIRTGFGGYELADEFVNDLWIDVPADWESRSLDDQMWWLVGRLRARDEALIEQWQWWRARKVALTVKELKEAAGITKPLFAFTLGWEMGHQHGQDILMMNDAGVDYNMVMLYEATKDEYDYLIKRWPTYLSQGQVNALPGISVDRFLLQNKWNPDVNQPYEMYDRYVAAVNGFYGRGNLEGLFWHDFERALYSRCGEEFRCMDYAVAGAAAFTRLRERSGAIPVKIKIGRILGGPTVDVTLVNTGKTPVKNVEVALARTHGVVLGSRSKTTVASLAPGEKKTVTLMAGSWDVERRHIIGAYAVWGARPEDRAHDVAIATLYKLPKKKPAETAGTAATPGTGDKEAPAPKEKGTPKKDAGVKKGKGGGHEKPPAPK